MEAGRLHPLIPTDPTLSSSSAGPHRQHQSCLFSSSRPARVFPSSSSFTLTTSMAFKAPKPRRNPVADWVSGNDAAARTIPIFTGSISLVAVLLNRAFSSIAPVADASSSQSRADILTLALAVTNLLTGLVWLSIQPKYLTPVALNGIECRWINSALPECAVLELLWAWKSLSVATCCRSFIVVHGETCLLQVGVAAESSVEDGGVLSVDVPRLAQGSLYRTIMESGKQSYLANLSLYPGRTELPFLPSNTQAVILQPLGDKGIIILGGDTIRGFTNIDQEVLTIDPTSLLVVESKVCWDLYIDGLVISWDGNLLDALAAAVKIVYIYVSNFYIILLIYDDMMAKVPFML